MSVLGCRKNALTSRQRLIGRNARGRARVCLPATRLGARASCHLAAPGGAAAFCAHALVERGDPLIDHLYAGAVQNGERHARTAVAKQREQTARSARGAARESGPYRDRR